jgi:hypothetical protein
MELRPELMPPHLDDAVLERLATLADRLDGARPGDISDELNEFNRLAGTNMGFEEFQGVYEEERHKTWVRRVLYSRLIKRAPGVTREELVEVVRRAMPESGFFDQHEAYCAILDVNVPRPNASSLIFYPPDFDARTRTWGGGRELSTYDPTPEQIVDWALKSPIRLTSDQSD